MRFNILTIAGLLLSTVVIAAPVDLSTRSDELLDSEDTFFARAPAYGDPSTILPQGTPPRPPSRPPIRHIGKRSDELEDEIFAREPVKQRASRIPRYVGGERPRAPTPRTMRPTSNLRSRIPRYVGTAGTRRPRSPTPNGRRN